MVRIIRVDLCSKRDGEIVKSAIFAVEIVVGVCCGDIGGEREDGVDNDHDSQEDCYVDEALKEDDGG